MTGKPIRLSATDRRPVSKLVIILIKAASRCPPKRNGSLSSTCYHVNTLDSKENME